MSAFPTTIPLSTNSSRSETDGTLNDQTEDGVERVRVMYTTTQYKFDIKTCPLTDDLRDDLLDHYAANKTGSFEFTWPVIYSVQFGGEPVYETFDVVYTQRPVVSVSEAHNRWEVAFTLAGTKN